MDPQNYLMTNAKDQSLDEIYQAFLTQHYALAQSWPRQICLPLSAQTIERLQGTKLHFPQRGKKAQLIKLASDNAKEYLEQYLSKDKAVKLRALEALKQLQAELGLKHYLKRIEAYDISNIQGTSAVGSMVVFTNGQPDKAEYRRFKIKTVKGANDPAMMAEVVKRRLNRMVGDPTPREGRGRLPTWPRPSLIILDGGLGQLNAVKKIVQNLRNVETRDLASLQDIQIVALAKPAARRSASGGEDTLYTPKKLQLKNEPTLRLVQHIRDEANRFAIGYHRKLRSKKSLH